MDSNDRVERHPDDPRERIRRLNRIITGWQKHAERTGKILGCTSTDGDIEDAAKVLTARLEAAEAENRCDVCDGIGTPINSKPCMCGGTGKMSEGVTYLRRELFDAEKERDDARTHLHEAIDMAAANNGRLEKENAELRAEVERLGQINECVHCGALLLPIGDQHCEDCTGENTDDQH